jgi:hypothetical protein
MKFQIRGSKLEESPDNRPAWKHRRASADLVAGHSTTATIKKTTETRRPTAGMIPAPAAKLNGDSAMV